MNNNPEFPNNEKVRKNPIRRRKSEEVLLDDITHATGFSLPLVEEYAKMVGQSNIAVMAALIMVHCNCRDEEVRMMMYRFTKDDRSTRVIMEGAYAVLDATMSLDLSEPFSRFDRIDENFPNTTCLVDGVPCFMRGSRDYYNGKHHDIMMSWQVFVGVRRQPLWYMGPFVGSMHDSKAFGGGEEEGDARPFEDLVQNLAFPHTKEELFNADKAYIANCHCLTEYKKICDTLKDGLRDLTPDEELYNEHFKVLRARVESFFAYLDRHRFLHYCIRKPKTIAKMWKLMWNLECLKEKREPSDLYADDLVKADISTPRKFKTACECDFKGATESVPASVKDKSMKLILERSKGKYPITKNSSHRRKGTPLLN